MPPKRKTPKTALESASSDSKVIVIDTGDLGKSLEQLTKALEKHSKLLAQYGSKCREPDHSRFTISEDGSENDESSKANTAPSKASLVKYNRAAAKNVLHTGETHSNKKAKTKPSLGSSMSPELMEPSEALSTPARTSFSGASSPNTPMKLRPTSNSCESSSSQTPSEVTQAQQAPIKIIRVPNNTAFSQNKGFSDGVPRDSFPKRIRYVRGPSFTYTRKHFVLVYHQEKTSIYKPEYTLTNSPLSDPTKRIMEFGLCPYCPDIRFFVMFPGVYFSHMVSEHGILSNGYIIPDPFVSNKAPSNPKSRLVTCPVCARNFEETTGFSSYASHFRRVHYKNTTGYSTVSNLGFKPCVDRY